MLDNYHTHKHDDINQWLAKNPRITLHFTPTSGSWMNLVEVFFGIITRQAIRRGSFDSVKQLDRRDPRVHRRLQRPLPALRLDQDRRRDPAPRHPSTNFRRATLAAPALTAIYQQGGGNPFYLEQLARTGRERRS